MGRRDRPDLLTAIQRRTFTFMWVSAVFALGALALWILGVPGVQNEYARGWSLGLSTLFRYVIGCGLLLIAYAGTARMFDRFQSLRHGNLVTVSIFWIFFFYSVSNIYRAVRIMFLA